MNTSKKERALNRYNEQVREKEMIQKQSEELIQKRKARAIGKQKNYAQQTYNKEQKVDKFSNKRRVKSSEIQKQKFGKEQKRKSELIEFRNTTYEKEVDLFFIQPFFCL